MSNERQETPLQYELRDLGQVYVTLAAAQVFGRALNLGEETARRRLTALLVERGRIVEGAVALGKTAAARARSRALGLDVTARVSREPDGLLAVVSVHVRQT